jgi:hypothetical protein
MLAGFDVHRPVNGDMVIVFEPLREDIQSVFVFIDDEYQVRYMYQKPITHILMETWSLQTQVQ